MPDTMSAFDQFQQTLPPAPAPAGLTQAPDVDPGGSAFEQFGQMNGLESAEDRHRRQGQRELNDWRQRVANSEENTSSWLGRHVNPFLGIKNDYLMARAQERMRQGRHEPGDAELIATQERLRQLDEGAGIGERIAGGVAAIPGLILQGAAGGMALRGAGAAMGGLTRQAALAGATQAPGMAARLGTSLIGEVGGGTLAQRASGEVLRRVAATPFMPSLYGQSVIQENQQAGRDPLDLRGVPGPMALAAVQNVIFGSAGSQVSRLGGQGAAGTALRTITGALVGVGEQQAADIVTSAVGLNTGYGLLGDLLEGHGDRALQHLAVQAATFAAFAGIHEAQHGGGRPPNILEQFSDTMRDLRRSGASVRSGTQAVEDGFHSVLDAQNRGQAMDRVNDLPQGPGRRLARRLVDIVHPLGEIEHAQPMGPEFGHEPYMQQGPQEAPGATPPAQAAQTPVEAPGRPQEAAPRGETDPSRQQWVNQGTEFRDTGRQEGARFEFTGSDGENYSIDHTEFKPGSEKGGEHGKNIIQIHNREGEVIAAATALGRPDGKVELHFYKKDAAPKELKGIGAVLHDYADTVLGDIVHPQRTAFGMHTSEAGLAVWRRNAELARRTQAANQPERPGQTQPGEPGASTTGGSAARPEPAPVENASGGTWQEHFRANLASGMSPRDAAAAAEKQAAKPVASLTPAEPRRNAPLDDFMAAASETAPHLTPEQLKQKYQHLERATTRPSLENIEAAEQAVHDTLTPAERQEQAQLVKERRRAIEETARELAISEASLRREINVSLRDFFEKSEVPTAGEGNANRPSEEAQGPAQAPGTNEAGGGTHAPANAGGRAAYRGELVDADRLSDAELQRRKRQGDRVAGMLLRGRVNQERPTTPRPEGAPEGWANWTNFERGQWERSGSDAKREEVAARNDANAAGREPIMPSRMEGVPNAVVSELREAMKSGNKWRVGKMLEVLDEHYEPEQNRALIDDLKDELGLKGQQTKGEPPSSARGYQAQHQATLERDQFESFIRQERAKQVAPREVADVHQEAKNSGLSAEATASLIGEADREAERLARQEVAGEGEAHEGTGSHGPGATDFNPAEFERPSNVAPGAGGNPDQPGSGTGGAGGVAEGPKPFKSVREAILGPEGLLRGQSGTAWVPSWDLLKEKLGEAKAGFQTEAARVAHKPTEGPKRVFKAIGDVADVSRAFITAYDLSHVFRQGAMFTFSHPIKAARALAESIRAFASKDAAERVMLEIRSRPNARMYESSGLYFADRGHPNQQEEGFIGRLVGKIPGLAGSERAFTTFLNRMRADTFDSMAASMGKSGEVTPVEARGIANYVNVASGRGSLGALENQAVNMARLFFSPRFLASRFQLLAGQPLWQGTGRSRMAIAGEYGRALIGLGLFYTLAKAAGGDDVKVTFDPRTSDFGKLRIGKTRIDPLAGLAQDITLVGRLASGQTRSTQTGRVSDLRGPNVRYGGQTVGEVVGRFLRSKAAPLPGVVWDTLSGKTFAGDPPTVGSVANDLAVPLVVRDIYEAMTQDEGVPRGVAASLLAVLGMGTQVYSRQQQPKRLGYR